MQKKYCKILVMAVIGIFILSMTPETTFAQSTQEKQLQKAREKEYKKKLKDYKKEGWKIAGSTRTLEVALLEYYAKLAEGYRPIEGEVSQCKSINVCKQVALINAQTLYASMFKKTIEGIANGNFGANADIPAQEYDNISGSFTSAVKADVSGVLISCFSIVKDNGTTKEYRTFFLIDNTKEADMINSVLERSVKETKLTIEQAKSISKFVQDELKKEE